MCCVGQLKKKMALTYFPLVQNQQHLPCSNEKIMYQHVLTVAWKAKPLLNRVHTGQGKPGKC